MIRNLIGIFTGIISAIIVIGIIESIGHFLFPLPPGIDAMDADSIKTNMDKIPVISKIIVLVAWAAGSFAGGFLTSLICTTFQRQSVLITALILMIFGIINMVVIPHPLWFWIIGILIFIPFAYLGHKITGK